MTTGEKVAYGVGGSAVALYVIKNTDVADIFGTTTTIDGTVTDDSSGAPLWVYAVLLIVILGIGAYITREVAG